MDITNQSGQIDEELKLLKTEIKQVLHNVQENVFNVQDPFGQMPPAGAAQEFASLGDSQNANAEGDFVASKDGGAETAAQGFSAGPVGDSPVSGLTQQSGDFVEASPAELSEFLESAGGPAVEAIGPKAQDTAGETGPGGLSSMNMDFAPSGANGDLTGAPLSEASAQSDAVNPGMYAEAVQRQVSAGSALPPRTDSEGSLYQTSGGPAGTALQGHTPSAPGMAIASENLKLDPQASIDALLAQQAAAQPGYTSLEAVSEPSTLEAPANSEFTIPEVSSEAGHQEDGLSANEYVHAGQVPPAPTAEAPMPIAEPEKRPQQDVFSKAALTYALSPSHSGGQGEQRSGDETMDLVTVAGLAQWAHGVLQRYGKEYLSAILEISQLTGRISKETKEIIMAIAPLLESASTEKGITAKQIVSMLAQLDAFLGTVSASDSRLLPFLLQDELEVFPLIRP